MTAPAYLDYFYGDEVKIDSFYRLPRVFLTSELYSDVSTEVKALYGLMLDRVSLSMRNGWREPDGRVFIYFTLNDAKRLLNMGKNKAVSLLQQMEKLDLICRRKQGQDKLLEYMLVLSLYFCIILQFFVFIAKKYCAPC